MLTAGRPKAVALVDAASGIRVTYDELRRRVDGEAVALRAEAGQGGIAVAFAASDVASVVTYLGALAAGVPVLLLDPRLDDARARALVARYRPEVVRGRAIAEARGGAAPDPALGLLLTTSGSLGSPKLVRLARTAVEANARAIAEALAIGPDEVAVTSLPLHYSYGLSVLNSHLVAGAAVVLTGDGLVSEAFWRACRDHGVTSLAGVPYSYQMLRRVQLERAAPASLRTLTQAGGALEPALVRHFHDLAGARGGALYVMYGQTEATARVAVMPPSELMVRPGAVGRAIPGGAIAIDVDGRAAGPGEVGEIVYRGPNVMMGYAAERDDLARGDDLNGELRTGDRGSLDADGYLSINGRSSRIAKVFGQRLDLDEVEALLRAVPGAPLVAAIADRDRVRVFVEGAGGVVDAIAKALVVGTGLHATGFAVEALDGLPRTSSGKLDYRALEKRP
jgi:acyl-CoA synthetase (AMP-forming)/AMP-acid ligase II